MRALPLGLFLCALVATAPADAVRDAQTPVGRFAVDEISGLAASRRHPGLFWAIRDSGPGPRATLYAVRLAGEARGPKP